MRSVLSFTLIVLLAFGMIIPQASAASKRETKSVFPEAISVSDFKAKYEEAEAGGKKVRILVVPGHEPMYGGAQYDGYYERELVVPLAEQIARELRKDPNFEVYVSRGTERWNDDFTRYYDRSLSSVKKFVDTNKKAMAKLMKRGKLKENKEQASHNAAPGDVALRLYGITKWSNEHDVDLMIHVHLNDSGGRSESTPGAYTGLAIYVPDSQFGNAKASKAIAEPVLKRLNTFMPTSNLPIEDKGIVEDQELIALGAYNTSKVPSILIEYGYIYERIFTDPAVRDKAFEELAYQTSRGVREFFDARVSETHLVYIVPPVVPPVVVTPLPILTTPTTTPIAVPVSISKSVCEPFADTIELESTDATTKGEVTRLQKLLAKDASVYPEGKITGYFGPATDKAVKAFQVKKGIAKSGSAGYGVLGPMTNKALLALCSSGV
ncbi:MAG: hypothetical protein AB199_01060 [Parcubacteria bacterium C7867-004]|nr:MAG: hypothetical protein AB199_01060 [Parcubacteria bacterium C7867-004]